MNWYRITCAFRGCVLGSVVVALVGCGPSGAANLSLNKDVAHKSLKTFLDAWTSGETVEALQSKSPKIVGHDVSWEAGQKLVRYELGAESDDGANLHVKVELVLGTEGGQESSQSATYIVGTSPVITVFRNE